MKKLEIESGSEENNEIIRAGGVKRVHRGWYTVWYNGVMLDSSVTVRARRNKGGLIKWQTP